ncbi:uncharacterized protein J3R85_005654 [Psidium guajava]|nr:uncharacterized protein J3R85_005654 [Psidium guajava]
MTDLRFRVHSLAKVRICVPIPRVVRQFLLLCGKEQRFHK